MTCPHWGVQYCYGNCLGIFLPDRSFSICATTASSNPYIKAVGSRDGGDPQPELENSTNCSWLLLKSSTLLTTRITGFCCGAANLPLFIVGVSPSLASTMKRMTSLSQTASWAWAVTA